MGDNEKQIKIDDVVCVGCQAGAVTKTPIGDKGSEGDGWWRKLVRKIFRRDARPAPR